MRGPRQGTLRGILVGSVHSLLCYCQPHGKAKSPWLPIARLAPDPRCEAVSAQASTLHQAKFMCTNHKL